ncbi:MAG TPA: GDCCVxC domain-containing (seleno)protein [Candidatus Krumholzibacteria bacterium]|nr:GDCCVxC domain-containing (seleno)protein [Candidatus Krumholzibacteria bacterium]
MEPVLRSVITCPECRFTAEEEMPTNACVAFYECKGCGTMLRPLKGDCCVFCSYGNVKCPPVQTEDDCSS